MDPCCLWCPWHCLLVYIHAVDASWKYSECSRACGGGVQIGTCTGAKNGGRRECDGPSQQTCNTEPCECNEHIVQEFSEIFGLNDTWCGVPPNFDSLVGPLKIRVGAVCGQLNFNSTKLDKQYAHNARKNNAFGGRTGSTACGNPVQSESLMYGIWK